MPNLEGELSGRLAVVTGASRGIGEAIALELGQAGAQVVGTATTAEAVEAIAANLAAHDIEGFGVEMNFLTLGEDEYAERIAQIVDVAGSAVSILVNNAGIRRDALSVKMEPWQVTEVIKVDLIAPILLTNA
ncbi:MAG TPA: SDR family NAD(P)-dependent oxidoreductase, partial [Candidatus Saccharimonadales bacterium]|nr:SDR family NAD(P)-dependent oxidoreductase [Candidatus Saccharimonadales bacterium]